MPNPTGGPQQKPAQFDNNEQKATPSSSSSPSQQQLPSTGTAFQQQQRARSRSMETKIRDEAELRKRGRSSPGTDSSEEDASPGAAPSEHKRTRRESVSSEASSTGATSVGIPVITEMDADEALEALENLKQSVQQWGASFGTTQTSSTGAEERWATRLRQTDEIIAEIEETECEADKVFVCKSGTQTIGMLLLDNMDPPVVTVMATHPESKAVGRALMEQAVNASQQWGKQGRLQADAGNPNSKQIALAAGFTLDAYNGLTLDPATSNMWLRNEDNQWQLSQHREMRYPVNFGE